MKHRIILRMSMILIMIMAFTAVGEGSYPGSWSRRDGGRSNQIVVVKNQKKKLKRQKIRGEVESVRGQVAYIRTSSGQRVGVQLGPQSYWEHREYRLVPGQRVTVVGWSDPYERSDWFFAGSIAGPGFSFSLTNDVGRPYWVTEYEYERGGYPTYEVYEVWYQPTYIYRYEAAPPTKIIKEKRVPPGHAKKRHHDRGRHHH